MRLLKNLFPVLMAGLFISAANHKVPPVNPLEKLLSNFYNFVKQFPQQKIYIHTDKPYYISGDELFGQVYLVNETSGGFDSLKSKKIYVELINEENTVIKKTIVNGLYSSLGFSFHLSDSISEGNYVLRAYTSWMAGFNNGQNIFSRFIHISNRTDPFKTQIFYTDSTLSTITVRVTDSLQSSYAAKQVNYQLVYKDKGGADETVYTNAVGEFQLNVSAISKENRDDLFLKMRIGKFKKLLRLPPVNNDIDVQFLPEGGSLVNGIENTVAFKAIDKSGHGTDVQGYIKDNKGTVVCNFSSIHYGMGKFSFIPESDASYIAYIAKNGRQLTYPLNASNNYAYQLSVVKRTNEQVRIRVALGDSLYKKNIATYLVATSRGRVCFTSRGIDLYEEDIPLNNFPEGIAQFTLFDSTLNPVSERLLYVHKQGLKVTITTNKVNYRRRENVTLQLKTATGTGKLLPGMYSVSVTDDHVVRPVEDDENIKTHLLLSPYLKGYIEHPGYYFTNDDISTRENLDLVMLTHG